MAVGTGLEPTRRTTWLAWSPFEKLRHRYLNLEFHQQKGAKPRQGDVSVAKNYLDERELRMLALLVSQYLDFAELQAYSKKTMTMAD